MLRKFEVPLTNKPMNLAKLAWGLLHDVLPREGRSEGILTNLKGLSSNNIIRVELPLLTSDSEHPLFFIQGTAPSQDESDKDKKSNDPSEKEDTFLKIETKFHGFQSRKKIQYSANNFSDGQIGDYLLKPVFQFNPEMEVNKLYFGLEYFEPHLFWMIGMAPKLSESILIQTSENSLIVRIISESQSPSTAALSLLLKELFSIDIGN